MPSPPSSNQSDSSKAYVLFILIVIGLCSLPALVYFSFPNHDQESLGYSAFPTSPGPQTTDKHPAPTPSGRN